MSPEVTNRKLSLLVKYLELLEKFASSDIPELNSHHLEVERLLHLIIEIMGDINHHTIVLKRGIPPKSLKESFLAMGELGVLDKQLASDLAPSAGLRNALVHMYDDIDMGFIQESIKKTLVLVPRYIKCVKANA
jgi:uncharacterized protein YutE (UPF0331/DUF86 family)